MNRDFEGKRAFVTGAASGIGAATSRLLAARGAFVGFPPALPSGTYPVTMRGQNCSSIDTGLTYTVP